MSIVEALLQKNAAMNLHKEVKMHTQTHLCLCMPVSVVINAVRIDSAISFQNGNTALMEASESGHNAVVKALVDNGADVEEKNKVCVL